VFHIPGSTLIYWIQFEKAGEVKESLLSRIAKIQHDILTSLKSWLRNSLLVAFLATSLLFCNDLTNSANIHGNAATIKSHPDPGAL
jgi:hypothetical protein